MSSVTVPQGPEGETVRGIASRGGGAGKEGSSNRKKRLLLAHKGLSAWKTKNQQDDIIARRPCRVMINSVVIPPSFLRRRACLLMVERLVRKS